jgi:hypothetical protein
VSLRPPRWLVRPLLAGLLLRLAVVFLLAPHVPLQGDSLAYAYLGRSLRTDASLPDLQGGVRPPLYPMLVALGLDGDEGDAGAFPGVYLLQCAADLAALVELATLARRAFGAKAGVLTAWLHAAWPSAALYAGAVVMAESFALLCAAVALERLDALDRRVDGPPREWLRPALGLGAALAAGMLSKELALLAVGATLLALLLRPGAVARRLQAAGLVLAAMAVVLSPWALRNLNRHGLLLLSGTFGDLSVIVENSPPGESGWVALQQAGSVQQKQALAQEIVRRQFLEYPGVTAQRAGERVRLLLGPEVMLPAAIAGGVDAYQPDARSTLWMARDAWRLPWGVGRALQLVTGAGAVLLFALAAAGLLLAGPGTLRRAALLAVLGLLLSTAMVVAIGRYRMAVAPFLLPFAGLGLAAVSCWPVRLVLPWPRRRAALRAGLAVGALLLLTIFLLPAP